MDFQGRLPEPPRGQDTAGFLGILRDSSGRPRNYSGFPGGIPWDSSRLGSMKSRKNGQGLGQGREPEGASEISVSDGSHARKRARGGVRTRVRRGGGFSSFSPPALVGDDRTHHP